MTQYNILNEKLSNSQVNKWKYWIKNGTEVTFNFLSNIDGDDETNFQHKLLLTNAQVLQIWKVFDNGSTINRKFSKTNLFRIIKSRGCWPILNPLPIIRPMLSSAKSIKTLILNWTSRTFIKKVQNWLPEKKLAKVVENKPTLESAAKHEKLLKNTSLRVGLNILRKQLTGSGIALANHEIKDIVKAINSLERRGIILKGTTKYIKTWKGGLLTFLNPLMQKVITP